MALKLRTNRKPHWIKVLENRNKPEGKKNAVLGMFQIVPLTPSEVHTIFKDCETNVWYTPPAQGKKQVSPIRESTVEDPIEFVIKKAKKTIVDWKDITTEDEGGNEIELPFSKDMIETLYDFNPDIINYILEEADKLSNLSSKSEDEELKN